MKSIHFFLLLLLATVLFSCDDDNDNGSNNEIPLTGSGPTIQETRVVPSFNRITASIPGNLYITQGAQQELKIKTHPNVMIELNTDVINEVLEIGFDRSTRDIDSLDIFITIPLLRSITFSGVGDIVSANELDLDELTITISGVGNTILKGEVEQFNYTLSGVGDLRAFNMTTTNSSITISGIGNAQITVTTELNAVISGTGNIHYKGNPSITSSISGSGSIINAN